MKSRSFDRKTLATEQLETAFRLFAERDDYLAVITLAGAAEELLGKLARERGQAASVESLAQAAVEITRHVFGHETSRQAAIAGANRVRDALKHIGDGATVSFDPEQEAADMLQRAVDNYWLVEQQLTPAMEAFERRRVAT